MKLNLLPTYVSKEGQQRVFIVLAVLVLLLSIGGAALMIVLSGQREATALQAANDESLRSRYAQAVAYANRADQDIQLAVDADRHVKLAQAMQEHNTDYLRLYNTVFDYIPSFMRVRSISAAPSNAESVTVTVSAIIETYQQYADSVMALLRIPGCVNVVRSGYVVNDRYVPNLSEDDQIGTAITPGESNLPSDPQLRWQEIINRASNAPDPLAFQNVDGFGSSQTDRGVMPGKSEVTFTITITGMDVMAPDPRATVMSRGGGAGTTVGMPGPAAPAGGGRGPNVSESGEDR